MSIWTIIGGIVLWFVVGSGVAIVEGIADGANETDDFSTKHSILWPFYLIWFLISIPFGIIGWGSSLFGAWAQDQKIKNELTAKKGEYE
jgi:hypothetical protein